MGIPRIIPDEEAPMLAPMLSPRSSIGHELHVDLSSPLSPGTTCTRFQASKYDAGQQCGYGFKGTLMALAITYGLIFLVGGPLLLLDVANDPYASKMPAALIAYGLLVFCVGGPVVAAFYCIVFSRISGWGDFKKHYSLSPLVAWLHVTAATHVLFNLP
jgi:hypothetical protein